MWALSSTPTIPGEFPCQSIFKNFNHLFWRAKELGATDEQLESFPWIIWFIWKARNEKAFNGEEISALDTAQWAKSEADVWKMAQVVSSKVDNDVLPDIPSQTDEQRIWPQCHTDASWDKTSNLVGLGFHLDNEDGLSLYGAKTSNNTQSATHAELDAINWAM
ncbi:unnamed protein product [Microthlaspi erraticum]|uniref:RNase H type-1 domain-containing protein n=1 Tax=Microthlaspi erraticum TaxID=1685480 RepID=A0A6D2LEE2_9BRAS|nr:unnamed protein product [Microthlaspi erraticum]